MKRPGRGPLPHVGLGGPQMSMYAGTDPTTWRIQEIPVELFLEQDEEREPIRVDAFVGEPVKEVNS